jgi:hypothetical protein
MLLLKPEIPSFMVPLLQSAARASDMELLMNALPLTQYQLADLQRYATDLPVSLESCSQGAIIIELVLVLFGRISI